MSKLLLVSVGLSLLALPADAGEQVAGVRLPASFTASIPGCDGSRAASWLNLLPDAAFYLRATVPENDGTGEVSKDEIGVWERDATGDTLLLHNSISGGQRIALDELRPVRTYRPIEPRLFLRGRFSVIDEIPVFRECSTSRRWRVVDGGGLDALLAAHEKYATQPEDERLVSLIGQIVLVDEEAVEEGSVPSEALVVERFGGLWPPEVCGRWTQFAPLEDRTWWLMGLEGLPVGTPLGKREPTLRLDAGEMSVELDGGCNRFFGPYEVEADSLRIGRLSGTAMHCEPVGKIELDYVDALGRVVRWEIRAGLLRLFDAEGSMVAWFEPRFEPRMGR